MPAMNSLRFTRALGVSSKIPPPTRSQVRHFHPTKPARLLNEALDASAGLIHGVHSVTGLPWVASIPLTAILVRTVVGLPLQIFTRVNARRERDIAPLLNSYRVLYQNEARNSRAVDPKQVKDVVKRHYGKITTHLHGRWKVASGYRFVNFLQLPVWISLMESLRGMSGNTNGLIPWILSIFSAGTPAESLHLTVEPTLANEGALWFPDLLAGDPSGILPALLTASILLNVSTGWAATPRHEMADLPTMQMFQSTFFRGLRVTVQLMAINVGVSAQVFEMPVALMIYWITSSNVATLQTYLLEKYMFMRPPIPTYREQFFAFKKPGVSDPFMNKLR